MASFGDSRISLKEVGNEVKGVERDGHRLGELSYFNVTIILFLLM